nr:unnamed protein product [Callosobruchus chinensis]
MVSDYENGVDTEASPSIFNLNIPFLGNLFRRQCPLCDSSVYSYCTENGCTIPMLLCRLQFSPCKQLLRAQTYLSVLLHRTLRFN